MEVKTISKEDLKQLYMKDFPLWVDINLQLLKEKAYELVDWDNLLEEIEDMGLRYLDACISFLAVILEHLYKLDNFKDIAGGETAGKSWIRSIRNSRIEIEALLDRYPSLRAKLPSEIDSAWIEARKRLKIWLLNNNYEPEDFEIPKNCPYTYYDAINRDVKKEG
ncbi:MAG: DUF29 domain-containing protein [Hydrogenothermaceae bacterium]|nr:DUF29 domain-containing protein [Hydrogenothermaceae bacterium]